MSNVYAEFVTGSIQNRNNIYSIKDYRLNGVRVDCFRSMFLYDEGLKYFVQKTGSIKGYSGKHTTDAIVFDFDCENDLTAVKDEVIKFIYYLRYNFDLDIDFVRAAYSGSKGFHIVLPIQIIGNIQPKENFYQIVKDFVKELTEGFQFVDYSIYESKRLIRLLNTKHSKTGLYKIPLTFNELENLSIDEIKDLAKNERTIEALPTSEISICDALGEVFFKHYNYQPAATKTENKFDEILNLFDGVNESGRHKALIRITAMLTKKNLSYDLILAILRSWNLKNNPPLPDNRLESESLRCYHDNKKKDVSEIKIFDLKAAEKHYIDYVKNIDSRKAKTGFDFIDKKIRGLAPGETMCILGKTSVGKSALLQNIGMNFARLSNEPVLFFSMEMPITSVYERACQIESGLTGYEIENNYRKAASNTNIVFTTLNNFYTVQQSGLDLEAIKDLILTGEGNIYHKKTGLVLIDYLGLVKSTGKDVYEQVSKVARATKERVSPDAAIKRHGDRAKKRQIMPVGSINKIS